MIKYLSNSSMNEWERCNWKFKLKRLSGKKYARTPALAPDAGIVFDMFCKAEINRRVPLEFSDNLHPEALKWGTDLFNIYRDSGALQNLINEGIGVVTAGIEKVLNGVPIYGLPDIIMTDGTIKDWKTNGVGSASGAYAKPGYYRRIDCQFGSKQFEIKPPHAKAGQPLELTSPQWAQQTCLYSFLNGRRPGEKFQVGIEQLAVHKTKLSICSYQGEVSEEFQMEVWNMLPRIWRRLQRGFFEVPVFSKFTCRAFGRRCEVADDCYAFQTHLQEMQKEDNQIL